MCLTTNRVSVFDQVILSRILLISKHHKLGVGSKSQNQRTTKHSGCSRVPTCNQGERELSFASTAKSKTPALLIKFILSSSQVTCDIPTFLVTPALDCGWHRGIVFVEVYLMYTNHSCFAHGLSAHPSFALPHCSGPIPPTPPPEPNFNTLHMCVTRLNACSVYRYNSLDFTPPCSGTTNIEEASKAKKANGCFASFLVEKWDLLYEAHWGIKHVEVRKVQQCNSSVASYWWIGTLLGSSLTPSSVLYNA